MISIEEKHLLILENEKRFADTLALRVLDKPQLSVWMILIPIIFVHYFYRMQKFSTGRKEFADHYMIGRKRALNEALAVIRTGKNPDIDSMAKLSTMPLEVRQQNTQLLALLVSHYIDLMRSEGDNFDSLIRCSYKTRTNYLLFINQLNQIEKALNSALKPHLTNTLEEICDIIDAIEMHSERLRRKHAEAVFP
jgi:hypothetical protein